jgi:hypothetical protein
MSTPANKASGGRAKAGAAAPAAAASTPANPRPGSDDIVRRLEEDIGQLRKQVASPIAHPYGPPSAGLLHEVCFQGVSDLGSLLVFIAKHLGVDLLFV